MLDKPRYSNSYLESALRPKETADLNGKDYNIELLRAYAEDLPVTEMPLAELTDQVGPAVYCWTDWKGEKLGPHQFIEDWPAAQKNPDWKDHVEAINNADLTQPVWFSQEDGVFDGLHRLTKAFLNGDKTILVKVWKNIPDTARVYNSIKDE